MSHKKRGLGLGFWIVIDLALLAAVIFVVILFVKQFNSDNQKQPVSAGSQQSNPTPTGKVQLNTTPTGEVKPSETPGTDGTQGAEPTDSAQTSSPVALTATPTPTSTSTPTPTMTPTPTTAPVLDTDGYESFDTKTEGWYYERNKTHEQVGDYGFGKKYKFSDLGVYYVNKDVSADDKVIYLTFDCGYENGYTEKILDTLKKHNAPAAFFVTQTYIRDAKSITTRMKDEGHIVGNHTVTHPNLSKIPTSKVIAELTECAEYMKTATGYDMDPFMRPPEGAYSEKSLHITNDMGYKTIFWSIAYVDWKVDDQPGKEYVLNQFEMYHHNGAIPLIHVVSKSNCEALDEVLTLLEKEGYRFGTLYELK